jgi:hypothetical protein
MNSFLVTETLNIELRLVAVAAPSQLERGR